MLLINFHGITYSVEANTFLPMHGFERTKFWQGKCQNVVSMHFPRIYSNKAECARKFGGECKKIFSFLNKFVVEGGKGGKGRFRSTLFYQMFMILAIGSNIPLNCD